MARRDTASKASAGVAFHFRRIWELLYAVFTVTKLKENAGGSRGGREAGPLIGCRCQGKLVDILEGNVIKVMQTQITVSILSH